MSLPAPPESSPADNPYQLGKRIALGGMAEVFLAVQQGAGGFEKLVVVKRMLPHLVEDGHFVQMFLDEARLASKLRHPNIVSILDIRRDDEAFTVAMEYLQGEDLRRLVRAQRDGTFRIPLPITLHIIGKLAEALHYAHNAKDARGQALNLVHRDVAPSNVIVTYDGQVKLIDFGVAKASAHSTYTKPGTIKGKFPYSSPEQVRGLDIDSRSDVFSLGILMHEMLTGQRLFKGGSTAATLRAVVADPIPKPSDINPDIPEAVDAIVMEALERDRNRRTQSADFVRQQITAALAEMMAKVTAKDLSQWMRVTFARNLEARIAMEKEAIAAARNQARISALDLPPAGTGFESGTRRHSTPTSHSQPGSRPGSRPSSRPSVITSRGSAPMYMRPSMPESRAAAWKAPLIVLVLVLVLVALIVIAFTAGRAAAQEPAATSPGPDVSLDQEAGRWV